MVDLYAGLDVSQDCTSICVVDAKGSPIFEGKTTTSPTSIATTLKPYKSRLRRLGHETGAQSSWLHKELLKRRFKIICLDARRISGALATQRNKTDRNDARGIACLLAHGYCSDTFVRSDEAQHQRVLLRARSALRRKARDLTSLIRAILKGSGYAPAEARAVTTNTLPKRLAPLLRQTLVTLLSARDALANEADRLDEMIEQLARADPVCRRFMTVPGVGPLTALAFKAGIENPNRFAHSRAVGVYFGLTPRRYQSGQSDVQGRISKRGDMTVRAAPYLAAHSLIARCKKPSRLRTWALRIKLAKGHQRACVACARKLAVMLHAMWMKQKDFEPG